MYITSKKKLPRESWPLFAYYIKLLKITTNEIDITADGANIAFTWSSAKKSNVSYNMIDFDIFCMGYNIIINLLNEVSSMKLNSLDDIGAFISNITCARSICDKLFEFYHVEFSNFVPKSKVKALSNYIDTFYIHAVIATATIKKPEKTFLIAKIAKLLSSCYGKCIPIQTECVKYFEFIANVEMSLYKFSIQEYIPGISYGYTAMDIFQTVSDKASIIDIYDSLSPFIKKMKYFEKVNECIVAPTKLDAIPQCKKIVYPAKFDFDIKINTIETKEQRNGFKWKYFIVWVPLILLFALFFL